MIRNEQFVQKQLLSIITIKKQCLSIWWIYEVQPIGKQGKKDQIKWYVYFKHQRSGRTNPWSNSIKMPLG